MRRFDVDRSRVAFFSNECAKVGLDLCPALRILAAAAGNIRLVVHKLHPVVGGANKRELAVHAHANLCRWLQGGDPCHQHVRGN